MIFQSYSSKHFHDFLKFLIFPMSLSLYRDSMQQVNKARKNAVIEFLYMLHF